MSIKKVKKEYKTGVNLDLIKPYWRNPRINEAAVDDVILSMEETGNISPIVVDPQMVITAGHTRYRALRKLKVKNTDVIIAHHSEEDARMHRIMDNKAGEKSEWDRVLLSSEIEALPNAEKVKHLFGEIDVIRSKLFDPPSDEAIQEQKKKMEAHFGQTNKNRNMMIKTYTCPHCGQDFDTPN